MTTKTEKKVEEEKLEKEVEQFKPSDYSCEIIQEKTTLEKSQDRKLPTDAFNVTYIVDGEECLDVTRSGKMVNVFNLYYDRYGKESVKKIDYGHGTVNPTQFGYKQPQRKRKRK